MNAYKSGVIHWNECSCTDPKRYEVNHAVTVVGYGTSSRPDCDEYWVVKNSWGAEWGEEGFFKLCADMTEKNSPFGACQINSYVMWPTL